MQWADLGALFEPADPPRGSYSVHLNVYIYMGLVEIPSSCNVPELN